MEPTNDPHLRKLLREWKVPDAPPSLAGRVLKSRKAWWSFLITGSIRIPVPVGLAILGAFLAMTALLVRQPAAPSGASVSFKDFRPVENPNVRIVRSSYEAQ